LKKEYGQVAQAWKYQYGLKIKPWTISF